MFLIKTKQTKYVIIIENLQIQMCCLKKMSEVSNLYIKIKYLCV